LITLTSCISVDYDLDFLPHFIKHYEKFGIDKYKFIFHSSEEFRILDYFYLVEDINYKVEIVKWVGIFNAQDKIEHLNKLQTEGYIITADVDEHHHFNLPFDTSKVVWGKLQDRECVENNLPELSSDDLQSQFPLITNKSDWGRSLYKPCCYPFNFKLLSPHHLERHEPNSDDVITIDHFRWVKGRLEKSIERLSNYNKLNKQGKRMYKFYRKFPVKDLHNVINEYGDDTKPMI